MDTGKLVEGMVDEFDFAGLDRFFREASEEDARHAREWYREHHRKLRDLGKDPQSRPRDLKLFEDSWIRALCAAALASPAQAATHIPWRDIRGRWQRDEHGAEVQWHLSARGAGWCGEFVEAAAGPGSSRLVVYPWIRALVDTHGLPLPTGRGFVADWAELMQPPFAEKLRSDPLSPRLVVAALRHGSINEFAAWEHPKGEFPAAIVALTADSMLPRHEFIAETIAAFDRPLKPATHRMLAQTLLELGLEASEIPGGLPAIHGLIATGHGSVSARMLPFALELVSDGDDLVELSATIISRPERGPKRQLAAALRRTDLADRVGAAAIASAAQLITEAESDAAIRETLRPLLAAPDEGDQGGPVGLWQPVAMPAPPDRRLLKWPAHIDNRVARGIVWRLENARGYLVGFGPGELNPWRLDLDLALIVIWAKAVGPDRLRATLSRFDIDRFGGFGSSIRAWISGQLTPESHRAMASGAALEAPFPAASVADLADLLAGETLLRVGSTTCLLSTPTYQDGALAFSTLIKRITLCQGEACGPLDVLHALLRLDPVPADAIDQIDGLALPFDPRLPQPDPSSGLADGCDLIRAWIRDGGLPELRLTRTEDGEWHADAELPAWWAAIPGRPTSRFRPTHKTWDDAEYLRNFPRWPDAGLAGTDFRDWSDPRYLDWLLQCPVPPGLAVHYELIQSLARSSKDERLAAWAVLLRMINEGRFRSDQFQAAACEAIARNEAKLARLAEAFEHLFHGGWIALLWPVALHVAAFGCARTPKPAGLADFLRLLATYANEVPDPVLPAEIHHLASSPGATKAKLEAQALLAAADRGGQAA